MKTPQWIIDLINKLKRDSKSYNEMLDHLTQQDVDESLARKILDVLIGSQDDEDDDE